MSETNSEVLNSEVVPTPTIPWQARFDRSNLTHLIVLFTIFTLYFAVQYAFLTYKDCTQGIKACELPDNAWQALADGFYFSIATETTVGYGDFAPKGYSRVLACVQALGGLCVAGLFVARITTGPSGKTKVLVDLMSGAWVEICDTDVGLRVSLITIRFMNGLLRYDGINFDTKGIYLGTFKGSSEPTSSINGSEIWFDYSNAEGGNTDAFTTGRTKLYFHLPLPKPHRLAAATAQVYDFFCGYAEDNRRSKHIKMVGYRVETKANCDIITSSSFSDSMQEERSRIAVAWLAHYHADRRRLAKHVLDHISVKEQ